MGWNYKNRATSTLKTGIDDSQTTLECATGEGSKFPSTDFPITIENERMFCSSRTGDIFTVSRGQESSTPAPHIAGKAIRNMITEGLLDSFKTDLTTHTALPSAHHTKYTNAEAKAACVDNTVYGPSWASITDVAPSKQAVYNKIEAMGGGGGGEAGEVVDIVVAAYNSSDLVKAWADYVCDGTGDHTEMQYAVDEAESYGGANIRFDPRGTYNPSSGVTIEGSRITLDFGNALVNWPYNSYLFSFMGSGWTGTYSNLTSSAYEGDWILNVGDTSFLSIGEWFILTAENQIPTGSGFKVGEYLRVLAKTSTTITVCGQVNGTYTTGNTARVRKVSWLTRVGIKGGRFVGEGVLEGTYLERVARFNYCDTVKVIDCDVDTISACAFEFNYSINCLAHGVNSFGSGRQGEGYTFAMGGACHNIQILDCTLYGCRHMIAASNGSGGYGGAKYVIIADTFFGGKGGIISNFDVMAIDCHVCDADYWVVDSCVFHGVQYATGIGARRVMISNCTVHCLPKSSAGWSTGAFEDRQTRPSGATDWVTEEFYVKNCQVYNGGCAVWICTNKLKKLVIENVDVTVIAEGNSAPMVYAAPASDMNGIPSNCDIYINGLRKSRVKNKGGHGIYLARQSGATNIHIQIINCDISFCDYSGVKLVGFASGQINNNKFNDNDQAGSTTQGSRGGISLDACSYIMMNGNEIRNILGSTQKYGIEAYNGCDYLFAFGNHVRGNTTSQIALVGSNSVASHNFGVDL